MVFNISSENCIITFSLTFVIGMWVLMALVVLVAFMAHLVLTAMMALIVFLVYTVAGALLSSPKVQTAWRHQLAMTVHHEPGKAGSWAGRDGGGRSS